MRRFLHGLCAAALAVLPVLVLAAPPPKPVLVLPDGGRYVGQLQQGLMHGRGSISWDDSQYEGEFVRGRMQGQGTLRRDDGTVYEGHFVGGQMDGHGRLQFNGGYVYEGQFSKDKPSGQGRLTDPAGTTIEGRFAGFQATSPGTITWRQGARYEGAFQDQMPHGPGTLTLADKSVLTGTFQFGELGSPGTIRYPDGAVYTGAVRDNQPHGQGELRQAGGDTYRGAFALGKPDGPGRLEQAGAPVQQGYWRAGSYIVPQGDGTVEETPGLAARNNEAVLYNQQALLQQQFSALQPSRGGPPQMYALFVAGDGSQEVFRREVAYVDALIARRFGTRDRTVRLVNSRSSAQRLQLATAHSIGLALQALAQKMDRERDLLFVFLTSHGSRTHELALGMTEMSLPDLPAARLGELLKASGIRRQVVVVSACYSGGFVPPLQGENTWVITAARADRSSFGCADENDFTYFGRALFKESLPTAPTLSAAVTQAIARVQEWEARDAKAAQDARKAAPAESKASAEAEAAAHSEPQSVVSPAFRAEVDAWFAAH